MNKARREERRAQKEAARRRNPDPLWWMEAERLISGLRHEIARDMLDLFMQKINDHIKGPEFWVVAEEIGGVCFISLESYREQCELIRLRLNPPEM